MSAQDLERLLDSDTKIEKAVITILEACKVTLQDGTSISYASKEKIPAQFNPTEIKLDYINNYKTPPDTQTPTDKQAGKTEDKGRNSLSLQLMYDSTAENSISNELDLNIGIIRKFIGLTVTDIVIGGTSMKKPPLVQFSYGSIRFVGYISRVGVECSRFSSEGHVIRATLDITMEEYVGGKGSSTNSGGSKPSQGKINPSPSAKESSKLP